MTSDTQVVPAPVAVVKPKKRVNSKKKGSNFEGWVGGTLAAALPPLQFRRSQSSGAILGGVNAKFLEKFSNDAKVLFVGDVVPTNEADVFKEHGWKFRFTLECKFYKTPENIEHLIGAARIRDWFSKAKTDAAKVGKEPLLIFKFNHTAAFCATRFGIAPEVKNTITLTDEKKDGLQIFLLQEALQQPEWWKLYGDPQQV